MTQLSRVRRSGPGRTIRVLMLVENLPLARDHRLLKQTAAMLASGFQVTVICRRHPGNKTCLPGVRVLSYPSPPEGSGLLAFAVEYTYSVVMASVLTLWVLARYGFDVLQVASTPDIYFIIAAPCRWLGRRVVFDFRDPSPETYEARTGCQGGAMCRVLLRLERRSLRSADRVLAVNRSLAQMARQRGGVDHARIVIVGNGPPLSRVKRLPARRDLRQHRRYLCCWAGLIGPQDRVDLALRAVAHLVHARGRTDCAFVFVGTGEALPAARRLAKDLGIEEWVSFPGFVGQDLVFDYLSSADLGLEPNTEEYVSPVKVMEYMAAGLPIVAFSAAETVLLAGEAARYARKGDFSAMAALIDNLLSDEEIRNEMGRMGQLRVTEFAAWEHQAKRYVAAVRQLAAQESHAGTGRMAQLRIREFVAWEHQAERYAAALRHFTGHGVWNTKRPAIQYSNNGNSGAHGRGYYEIGGKTKMRLLQRYGLWIAIATIVGLGGAWLATVGETPQYTSTAQVDVEANFVPNTTPVTPNLATEEGVAVSGVVLSRAAPLLGLTPSHLASLLHVSVSGTSNILSISCTMPSAAAAQRCAAVTSQAYISFRNEATSSRAVQRTDLLHATLVTPAPVPLTPSGTHRSILLAIGALLGLLLGIGTAFVRDRADDGVRDRADFERCLGAPVLVTLPRLRRDAQPASVFRDAPLSSTAEAYRYLRVRLGTLLTTAPGEQQVVLVASARGGEGRTCVASNLATVLAQTGERVLLVDADLGNPSLADVFGAGGHLGLAELLNGRATIDQVVAPTVTGGLHLVTAGLQTGQPAAEVDVERLSTVIASMAATADVVVIDGGPVLVASSTIALAPISDLVLVVADVRRTTRADVTATGRELKAVGARSVAGVLNAVARPLLAGFGGPPAASAPAHPTSPSHVPAVTSESVTISADGIRPGAGTPS
jgi:capsular exopolysaccharide synthesis family protein